MMPSDTISSLSTELPKSSLILALSEPMLEMTQKSKNSFINKIFCFKEDKPHIKPPTKRKRSKTERKRSKQKRKLLKRFFRLRAAKATTGNKFEDPLEAKSFWSTLIRFFYFGRKKQDQNLEDFESLLCSLDGNATETFDRPEPLSPTESFSICGITTERISPIVTSALSAAPKDELQLVSLESSSCDSRMESKTSNNSSNTETKDYISIPTPPATLSPTPSKTINPFVALKPAQKGEKPTLSLETWPILGSTPIGKRAALTSASIAPGSTANITPISTQGPETIFSVAMNDSVNESPITIESDQFNFVGTSNGIPKPAFDISQLFTGEVGYQTNEFENDISDDFEDDIYDDFEDDNYDEYQDNVAEIISIVPSSIESDEFSDSDELSMLMSKYNHVYPFKKFKSYTP